MTKRNDTPKSFRFSDQEIALLDRVSARHGGSKKAVIAGLLVLDGAKPVNVAAELRRLADQIERKS
jgi:hypothetical protein